MRSYTVNHGTAPANLVVVQGIGRALNPTKRSGAPTETNLSAFSYDSVQAQHKSGKRANLLRTVAFDTPVKVWEKKTLWMTVSGGREGLSMTFSPSARVVFAEIRNSDGSVSTVQNISLKEYMETYC